MSNIVSFEEARARRDRDKLPAATPAVQNTEVRKRPLSVMKAVTLSGVMDSLFLREARRFRFTNMANPPAFVIMKTSILPLPFPPDPPPPLVA